jgi:hypothetical protein
MKNETFIISMFHYLNWPQKYKKIPKKLHYGKKTNIKTTNTLIKIQ